MSTDRNIITVSDIPVEIVRKDIKNLHLSVNPPEGSVRISVPNHISDDNARLAVISRLSWIKKRQHEFKKQPRQAERQYVNGESHFVRGRRYILDVVERSGKHEIELRSNAKLRMYVRPGTNTENKALLLDNWYRQNLKSEIADLLDKWLPIVGKPLTFWGVKRMKTKWGSCNTSASRIWINAELAKKSPECLEYILVHELVHLHERHHNDNFLRLMEKYLPSWRQCRDKLTREPLAHEDWEY